MKDIIEEMRAEATMAQMQADDYMADKIADWASRLESMQPAAGPWPEDDHDYDAEERLSVLMDTFYTAYQDYDGDHVRLAPMRDDTQSAIEAAIEAVCAVLGRTTRSVGFCAAGPWRTDVENAEPTKQYIAATKGLSNMPVSGEAMLFCKDLIIAFAELNPYQPEGEAHE